MLIRYLDDNLRDIPDELAIAILADPTSEEDISEYTSHWVNVIVHGVLGTMFDEDKNFEENVSDIISKFPQAPESRKAQALELIKAYNIEVEDCDIGMFPASDMI
ncbi:MAG: hypothetical protein COB04_18595 [Gammaproteobacteria bacterium]|nr:MAG: hypothetical protein COB04_18595 [Gammaproteobacteria bacterium]